MYVVCICLFICEETRSQCGVTIALHFLPWDRASQWSWWLLFQLCQEPGSTGNLPSSPAQGFQEPGTACPTSYTCVRNITQFIRHAQRTLALTSTQHSSCKRCCKIPAFKCLESTPKWILSLIIHFSHYSEFISKAHIEDCVDRCWENHHLLKPLGIFAKSTLLPI